MLDEVPKGKGLNYTHTSLPMNFLNSYSSGSKAASPHDTKLVEKYVWTRLSLKGSIFVLGFLECPQSLQYTGQRSIAKELFHPKEVHRGEHTSQFDSQA